MRIFQRTFSSAPHRKWTSRGLDASYPTCTSPGGRDRQAGAGGAHPQSRRKLPWPCFFAYLIGKDEICLQPPLCYSTPRPTHHWWYESFYPPGGLSWHSFRGEMGCAYNPSPRTGAFQMEKSEPQHMSTLMVPQPITHARLLREDMNDGLTQTCLN